MGDYHTGCKIGEEEQMTSAFEPIVMATYKFWVHLGGIQDYRNVCFEPLQQERASDRTSR
jgi:hypothetical protein